MTSRRRLFVSICANINVNLVLATMSGATSKLEETANAVIAGYQEWDIEKILLPRAANCTQQVIPYSLNRPILNNEQYREFFAGVMPHFKNWKLHVISMIVDETRSKVCVHARSTAETALGPYANEYSVFMTMTEDHEKATEILEFVDSKYSDDFFVRLRAHQEKT